MFTIYHDLHILAPAAKVFKGISEPSGLDEWWTYRSQGKPELNATYSLEFPGGYDWRGTVSKCIKDKEFELEIHDADPDWNGTRVGFLLQEQGGGTALQFYHAGWKVVNPHFRISSFCWAMYLRILKRFLESGIRVAYEKRDQD